MDITRTGRLLAGNTAFDTDLRHLQVHPGPGGPFLYAATGTNGGLAAWRLLPGAGGGASLTDTESYAVSGVRLGRFEWVTLDAADRRSLEGAGSGGLVQYARTGDGGLTGAGQAALPGAAGPVPAALAAVTLADGRGALYMADGPGAALRGWRSDGAGGFSGAVDRPGTAGDYALRGAVVMDTAMAWGGPVLLVADQGTRGLRSFQISQATGALTPAGSLGAWDGLGISGPTALETVSAFGATWAVLAAAGSGSLSVMRISADGGLGLADHLIDTRATRFGGVSALKVVKAGDHVLVLAGGGDDGLTLLELLPDGRLVHRQSLAHAPGRGLMNVTAIEAVELGGALQVFVTSGVSGGITRFLVPLDDLGVVAGGAGQAGAGAPLTGTADADTMLARAPQDRLLGLGGDDILVAGPGGGELTGGAGRDIFVLGPASGALTVTDFTPGADRLDLTAFPMLRSVAQLGLTPFAQGIRLTHGGTMAEIRAAGGGPLTAAQLFPAGLGTPDRVPIPPGPVVRVTWGTAGDDVITRDAGPDTIRALAGNDTIRAGGGENRVYAGAGNDEARGGAAVDLLFGEAGDDRLYGEAGDDRLHGGGGQDRIWAGPGQDMVFAGDGKDQLYGGDGRDLLRGEGGDDTILAGPQDDRAYGDKGRDTVRGEAGNDQLWGGADNDTVHGGPGNDMVYGETGDDRLYGRQGGDRVWGGPGRDTIYGGDGDDRLLGWEGADLIRGEAGADTIRGGAGNDTVYGGPGNDRLWGEAGADTFVFAAGHGADRVYGFAPGLDHIRLPGHGGGFAALDIRAQPGGGALIVTGAGSVVLDGVAPGALDAGDFLFW